LPPWVGVKVCSISFLFSIKIKINQYDVSPELSVTNLDKFRDQPVPDTGTGDVSMRRKLAMQGR
jgi:hypothetical protein